MRRSRALVAVVVTVAAAVAVTLVVRYSPLFEIHRITATPTEHISSSTISSLAAVPEGSTLFNVDAGGIRERLGANPWVGSVRVGRTLPDQLDIYVTERATAAVVMMSNGTEAWRISDNGFWLEPIALQEAASSEDLVAAPAEQAQAAAASDGVVYVTETAATVRPSAGKACDDDGINALLTYLSSFGPDLRRMIVTAKAGSRESLSVILDNGVEVALGAPVDVGVKEQVVLNMLREHEGEVTYINVRVTTSPTWRGLTSGYTKPSETDDVVVDVRSGEELDGVLVGPPPSEKKDDEAEKADGDEADGDETASEPVGTSADGSYVDWDEALFEGGYYDEDGTWVYAYYDEEGYLVHGYYDYAGEWVDL